MARPKKSAVPDLSSRVNLTAGAIERLACAPGKQQEFMRDSEVPGLRVRVTAAGAKSFVYESKLDRRTIRRTIGDVKLWSIDQARVEARRLAVLLDRGHDPREIDRQQQIAKAAERAASIAKARTVGEVWPVYLENGKPKRRDAWKPRYRADLVAMASPGGEKKKRGNGVTRPGPIYPLLALPLSRVTEDALKSWYDGEALKGKHQAARALMMFRGFLRWIETRPEYRGLVDREAGRAPAILENLPATSRRTDKLLKEQIAGWWAGTERLHNRVHSVYLRTLLLTGARRDEVASLRWIDVDLRWKTLTLSDKVDQTRTIPMSQYLAGMLAGLPRTGEFVFHSTSKAGYIKDPRASMAKVLQDCGVAHLTFHGLRRTFTQVARGIVPAGAPAQISGHKPSAVAEGYAILTLDELRPYMDVIESEFLRLAAVGCSPATR